MKREWSRVRRARREGLGGMGGGALLAEAVGGGKGEGEATEGEEGAGVRPASSESSESRMFTAFGLVVAVAAVVGAREGCWERCCRRM